MGKIERKFHSLTFKSLVGALLITFFIGAIMLFTGYSLYFNGVLYEYRVNTCNLAKAEVAMIDKSVGKAKAEEVLKIYDSIPEEEKGDGTGEAYLKKFDGTIDDDYRDLQVDMRKMQNEVGLRNAFLVAIDPKNNRMVYIVDADPDPETVCHPGTWDEYTDDEIHAFIYGEKTGRFMERIGVRNDYQATVTNTEKYGLRCTGGATLSEVGDYTVMICLDERLDHMIEVSTLFLLRYAILLFIVVGIAVAITLVLSRKSVVKPIDLLAEAARDYTKDKQQGIRVTDRFSQLDIRAGDEIEELDLAMKEMERSLTEYEQNLTRATAERQRINTELNLARSIQMDTLPSTFPAFPDRTEFDVYASMDPAKEVGGDFYDFFLVDDDHLAYMISDVSGKGIPAALFMMTSKMILNNLGKGGFPPSRVLEIANNAICAGNREDMFITVSFGILELSTGKIVASNAGHENPMKIHKDGKIEEIKNKHGFVIGGMPDMKYGEYEIQLEPGDKLFLYTDGVPEATNKDDEAFGIERMLRALGGSDSADLPESADDRSAGSAITPTAESTVAATTGSATAPTADPKESLEGVRTALDEFVGDAEQFDDITMLCLQYYGK